MIEEKKKKNSIIICWVLLILTLAFIIYSCYLYFFGNTKNKFVNSIQTFYSKVLSNSKYEQSLNILKSNIVGVDLNADLNIDSDQINEFNNGKMNLKYIEDKSNKKGYYEVKLNQDDNDLLNIKGIMENDKIHIKIPEVLDKYFNTEYEFINILEYNNGEDVKYIYDLLIDSANSKITKDLIKEKDTTEKINGKDIKVKKMTLEITNKLLSEIALDFMEKIENDNKALDILVDLSKTDKEELKKGLNSIIEEEKKTLKQNLEELKDVLFTYNSYLKDNEPVIQEISFENTSALTNCDKALDDTNCIPQEPSIINLKMIINNDYNEIRMTEGENDISLIINGKEEGTIELNYNKSKIATGNFDSDGLSLTVEKDDSKVIIETETVDSKNTDKEISENQKINVTFYTKDKLILKGTANIDMKVYSNATIPNEDVSNSVNINNISEEDKTVLKEYICNNSLLSSLFFNVCYESPFSLNEFSEINDEFEFDSSYSDN